jgi:choline-sulfatase
LNCDRLNHINHIDIIQNETTMRIITLLILLFAFTSTANAAEQPNILIISIDDLNDWTGCLGGHPQAKTPNIDRLAKRGTLFRNAHCQAPVCTSSRASMLTGLYPTTTGLYFLQPGLEASKIAMKRPHLLRHFAKAGYRTMGAGKFVHGGNDGRHYQEYGGSMGGFGPLPKEKISDYVGHKLWDWGAFPKDETLMPDNKVADWVIERLKKPQAKPFVLVAGFWRPHVPMYAPPQWFKKFPLKDVKVPVVQKGDRDDISEYAKTLTEGFPAPRHEWFEKNNTWKEAVQSYLASTAYVDNQAGRVLKALEASPHHKNTIVILLSDHGWHLGEKRRWAKRSLWNDGTRVPLIVAAPGIHGGNSSDRPVGLIDLFPTLLDLAGLPPRKDNEGRSLVPLMKKPNTEWNRPILTSFAPANHSLRSTRWHYIRYGDGSEELYDHENAPHEWRNLAAKPENAEILNKMRKALPKKDAEPLMAKRPPSEVVAWRKAEQLRKSTKSKKR